MMAKTFARALREFADRLDPPQASVTQEDLDSMRDLAEARRMLQTAEEQAEVLRLSGRLPGMHIARHW